jgi:DNA-binding XRE family transcriptional regulator
MGIQIMEPGTPIPQRKNAPKAWTRRAIAAELGKSPDTIYKWEREMHEELLQLPHSFKIWEFLVKQDGLIEEARTKNEKVKRHHPPLDNYQIECFFLLGELRKTASANTTIAQTVKDNGGMFYELHQLYSPLHPKTGN